MPDAPLITIPGIAVISAIFGAYDEVKPVRPQEGVTADWVLVTDEASTAADAASLGWRTVLEPRGAGHPCRAAKHPKFRPWEYTTAPASVWVDGSVRVISPFFAASALALADPLAQFAHPDRDCIYAEAAESARIPKYAGEPVAAQAACYRVAGHPEHWGLWAATVIARRHTPEVRRLGEEWTRELDAWSFQDQVSEPYVLRRLGLRPSLLSGYYRDNQWLRVEASGKHL